MAAETPALADIRDTLLSQLDRCAAALAQAPDDAAVLALRDLLLDAQFESRALITAAEERLGAYSGDEDPRAIAANAEVLVEQVEGLQDAWESRVALLLEAGIDDARASTTLTAALSDQERKAKLDEFFAGLSGDMDQTSIFLEYAKRYLLSLIEQPPADRPPITDHGKRSGSGRRR